MMLILVSEDLQEQGREMEIVERNKIVVKIKRNNYTWFHFVKSLGKLEKDSFIRNWNSDTQMIYFSNFQISKLGEEMCYVNK